MDIQDLVDSINGKLIGNDDFFSIDGFTGKFTFLHEAHTGEPTQETLSLGNGLILWVLKWHSIKTLHA